MSYELYYWPMIQGRGEFVRLALEFAGIPYEDIARKPEDEGGGISSFQRFLRDESIVHSPFAPPFLKAGDLIIGQTANILQFLGTRHALAPGDDAGRLWTHQLQLTVADLLVEIHDTHHPIAGGLYYEQQKPEAMRRSSDFRETRLPKYLDYFERVLASNPCGDGFLAGAETSYADLSLFQIVTGLRYAFPVTMMRLEGSYQSIIALHDRVRLLPGVAAYLSSERRIPFNNQGIFRHYPELDYVT